MPITLQSYTSAAVGSPSAGVTSLTCALPATTASGQVMIAAVNVNATVISSRPVLTTPAGWTLLDDNGSFGSIYVYTAVLWKLGDGSVGNVLFAFDQGVRGEVFISVADEINPAATINAHLFTNYGTRSHTIIGNAITTTVQNCLIIGVFVDDQSGLSWVSSDSLGNIYINQPGASGGSERPLLLAYDTQAVAGSTGAKQVTTSNTTFNPQVFLLAIAPALNPSIPVLTSPNGGESLTVGAVVNITWNASTSSSSAQATLKYNLDYSTNNGSSWTSIVALTSAGATSYAWTVPATIGSGYLIRIRSNDPALSLYSLGYDQSNSAFSVVIETTPGQPSITAPTAGSVYNKAVNVTVSWAHQGGVGNPQTDFTLQWDDNIAFSSPTTVGPTATGTQSTSIDFSALAAGTTVYVKAKTKGVSLYSPYSNVTSFIVASLPATPNITAPTNASPPTTPLPTITFTEADAFVSRRMRVVIGGVESYNSGEVSNTALSFTSPFVFGNGVTSTLYISVKNAYGLWSAEDSETVTPVYAGPTAPGLVPVVVDAAGYILLPITNADGDYNELWRFLASADVSTAIQISPRLELNASFLDSHAISGVAYKYFARTYNAALFTDSTPSASVALTISRCFLHLVSRTNANGNADGVIEILLQDGTSWGYEESAATHRLLGRSKPVGVAGQGLWRKASIVGEAADNNATLNRLTEIFRAREIVCIRDYVGHRLFGKITSLPSGLGAENIFVDSFSFEVTESKYREGL